MDISFYKTIRDMLNCGSMNALVAIRDPPVSRPHGRPSQKGAETISIVILTFNLTYLGGQVVWVSFSP